MPNDRLRWVSRPYDGPSGPTITIALVDLPVRWIFFMIPKNTKITLTLTLAQWEQIEEAANGYCDMGPTDEGWKSDELSSSATAFEHALRDAERSFLAAAGV